MSYMGKVRPTIVLDSTDLADDAVTSAKIADDAVSSDKIADTAVTSAKIADGAIVNVDVDASAAIDASKTTALPLSGGTMSGETVFADQLATRPKMKDYSEAINAIGSITAGTNADLEDGNVQTVTMTANTFNFGITNGLASNSNSLTLVITNGGLATVTWKAGAHDGGGNNIKWAGGSAPTLTSSGVDVICFTTVDGGTNFYGFSAGLDMS